MVSICICGLERLTEACEDMVYSMNLNVEELEWFRRGLTTVPYYDGVMAGI